MTRQDILNEAYYRCMSELYKKAQPSADYDELVAKVKSGEIDENITPVHDMYYLSADELKYIVDKYIEAYGMTPYWKDTVEMVENYLKKGGYRDVYIEEEGKPGHRGYEKTPKLADAIGEDNANKVFEQIGYCKDFYRFDREASDFSSQVYLSASPTSNKSQVIEYWKNKGVDVVIEDRDPDTLWYRDEYGDKWENAYKEETE